MTQPSAIHHMLAILAGDSTSGDAGLPGLIAGLGFSGLAPDPLDGNRDRDSAPRFVRLTFPGLAPTDAFIVDVAAAAGLRVESLAPSATLALVQHGASGGRHERWLLIGPQPPAEISCAVARLRAVHRIHAVPFRTVKD